MSTAIADEDMNMNKKFEPMLKRPAKAWAIAVFVRKLSVYLQPFRTQKRNVCCCGKKCVL